MASLWVSSLISAILSFMHSLVGLVWCFPPKLSISLVYGQRLIHIVNSGNDDINELEVFLKPRGTWQEYKEELNGTAKEKEVYPQNWFFNSHPLESHGSRILPRGREIWIKAPLREKVSGGWVEVICRYKMTNPGWIQRGKIFRQGKDLELLE